MSAHGQARRLITAPPCGANVDLRLSVLRSNARELLTEWADAVGYTFSDADWDAVAHGLAGLVSGVWDYPLVGDVRVTLAFNLESDGAVGVAGKIPVECEKGVAATAAILACYRADPADLGLAGLIAREFGGWPRPADGALLGCSPEHLAKCPECPDAASRFAGVGWEDLAGADLPWGYAGAACLSDEGRRYFLPAFLLAAIRHRSAEALDELLLGRIAGREQWTALQRRLVRSVSAQAASPASRRERASRWRASGRRAHR